MKGFVPTPSHVVDLMVSKLFAGRTVSADSTLLDPGCGDGEFIAGILRFCQVRGAPAPKILGVELDPRKAASARARFVGADSVTIECADFLAPQRRTFDHVIGNPPYVSIGALSVDERTEFRSGFVSATGRFDLYSLFFEQALRLLRPDGRLVFVTPEKFTYVESARTLRGLLSRRGVAELHFCPEDTFDGYVTYPVITTLSGAPTQPTTRIRHRGGAQTIARLPESASWMPAISGFTNVADNDSATLSDYARRISCGVATGADRVFVVPQTAITSAVLRYAFPTISGRQLVSGREVVRASYLLAPYSADGSLLPEAELGSFGDFLREPQRRKQLEARACVARKPWYAFHDNFPIRDMLRPKILTKDIAAEPVFVVDRAGDVVPRHSVYYIVPRDSADLDPIAQYLDSSDARAWLRAHCQRAATGCLRLQSHVLKQLPIPLRLEAQLLGRRDVPAQGVRLPT